MGLIDETIIERLKSLLNVKVKFANKGPHADPSYATALSSGMDVHAWICKENAENDPHSYIDEDGTWCYKLKPLDRVLVHTGIYMELPKFTELQVRPRSGWALKKGITVLNSPGTIDNDYRNEIGVILVNNGIEDVIIKDNDKVAQFVVVPVLYGSNVTLENIDDVSIDTERGLQGFGHSGR